MSHLDDPDADDDALSHHSWRELAGFLLPYYARYRRELLLAVVLLLAVIAFGLMAPFVLGQVIDLATGSAGDELALPLSRDRQGILVLAGLFVGVVLLAYALEAWLGFLMSRVGISMVLQLKEDLFRRVLTLDPEFFREYPPGRLIARVESDTEALKELFSFTGLQLLRASLTFVGIFACMLAFDVETSLALFPVLLLIAVGTMTFVRLVRRYFHRSRRFLAAITGHITEYVQGIEVVQHYDYGPRAEERLGELQTQRYRADVVADFLNYGFWGFFGACEVSTAALVLWVGIDKVVAGTMSLGTLVVFLEYLRQVFLPLQLLSEFMAQIQRGMVSAGRIFGILGETPRTPDRPDAAPEVAFADTLRFEDVRFSYDGEHEVLRGVSFEVPRGHKVALVGASGGGKSTLVKLLLRFHEPSAGRISVDGRDLREFARAAWRAQVGLVPQEVFLFPGTLGENLSVFDRERGAEEVAAACRTVRAERLLDRLPGGLTAELAERGANLSHGERQLVSLARAVGHRPQLLVLDEATSSIDPRTEAAIQESLERLLEGRTALIVAHRLSTVRQCDQILVVAGGRIVERGTHDELWANPGGAYRALAELQLAADAGGSAR